MTGKREEGEEGCRLNKKVRERLGISFLEGRRKLPK
jgi:hypothetical protein